MKYERTNPIFTLGIDLIAPDDIRVTLIPTPKLKHQIHTLWSERKGMKLKFLRRSKGLHVYTFKCGLTAFPQRIADLDKWIQKVEISVMENILLNEELDKVLKVHGWREAK